MSAALDYDEIVRRCVSQGVPKAMAERAAALEISRRNAWPIDLHTPEIAGSTLHRVGRSGFIQLPPLPEPVRISDARREASRTTLVHVGADRFAICKATFERQFDTFRATFELPPRTKKNSTRWFGVQSAAYTRYRNAILDAVAESRVELGLPLPNQPFNLAAVFYVDRPGERADLMGLLQGLCDALQDASVVTNDWHFRRTDGSRIVLGDDRPRVELVITPIED